MSRKLPHYQQAHLLRPPARKESGEAAAARALQVERDRRGADCLKEVLAALERHGCTFQVVVQDIQRVDQPGVLDRRTQVNVLALDKSFPPEPLAGAPAGLNGGKPAA